MDRECYQKALGEEGMQLVKPLKFFSATIILLACPHANLVYVAIFRSVSMPMGFACPRPLLQRSIRPLMLYCSPVP